MKREEVEALPVVAGNGVIVGRSGLLALLDERDQLRGDRDAAHAKLDAMEAERDLNAAAVENALRQRDACAVTAERLRIGVLDVALEVQAEFDTDAHINSGTADKWERDLWALVQIANAPSAAETALAERDTREQRVGRDDARRAVIDMLDDTMFLAGEEAWKPVFAAIAQRDARVRAAALEEAAKAIEPSYAQHMQRESSLERGWSADDERAFAAAMYWAAVVRRLAASPRTDAPQTATPDNGGDPR